jgi:hypothetical protein
MVCLLHYHLKRAILMLMLSVIVIVQLFIRASFLKKYDIF